MMDQVMSVIRVHPVRTSARLGAALALVTTVLAAAATTTPEVSTAAPAVTTNASPKIALARDKGSSTSAAAVPLASPARARSASGSTAAPVLTGKLDTSTYKMVAVTWLKGDPTVDVRYR